jgi:glycerol uptake facilitator-like aquaporin
MRGAPWPGQAIAAKPFDFIANPAVTIARSFSNTFAGIAAAGVLSFIQAQTVGMLVGRRSRTK